MDSRGRRCRDLRRCPTTRRGRFSRNLTALPPNCVTPVKLLLAALRSSLTGETEGRLFRGVEVWPCIPLMLRTHCLRMIHGDQGLDVDQAHKSRLGGKLSAHAFTTIHTSHALRTFQQPARPGQKALGEKEVASDKTQCPRSMFPAAMDRGFPSSAENYSTSPILTNASSARIVVFTPFGGPGVPGATSSPDCSTT